MSALPDYTDVLASKAVFFPISAKFKRRVTDKIGAHFIFHERNGWHLHKEYLITELFVFRIMINRSKNKSFLIHPDCTEDLLRRDFNHERLQHPRFTSGLVTTSYIFANKCVSEYTLHLLFCSVIYFLIMYTYYFNFKKYPKKLCGVKMNARLVFCSLP